MGSRWSLRVSLQPVEPPGAGGFAEEINMINDSQAALLWFEGGIVYGIDQLTADPRAVKTWLKNFGTSKLKEHDENPVLKNKVHKVLVEKLKSKKKQQGLKDAVAEKIRA